jgi:hypothetical protein
VRLTRSFVRSKPENGRLPQAPNVQRQSTAKQQPVPHDFLDDDNETRSRGRPGSAEATQIREADYESRKMTSELPFLGRHKTHGQPASPTKRGHPRNGMALLIFSPRCAGGAGCTQNLMASPSAAAFLAAVKLAEKPQGVVSRHDPLPSSFNHALRSRTLC